MATAVLPLPTPNLPLVLPSGFIPMLMGSNKLSFVLVSHFCSNTSQQTLLLKTAETYYPTTLEARLALVHSQGAVGSAVLLLESLGQARLAFSRFQRAPTFLWLTTPLFKACRAVSSLRRDPASTVTSL